MILTTDNITRVFTNELMNIHEANRLFDNVHVDYDKKLKQFFDLFQEDIEHSKEETEMADAVRSNIYNIVCPFQKSNKDIIEAVLTRMSGKLTLLSNGNWNSSIWNAVINSESDKSELLRYFMEYADYHIMTNGNPVRHAVYANRLPLAYLLLEKGFKPVDKINMFQIAQSISWDPVRLRFLIDNGCDIVVSEKELETIQLIIKHLGMCNNL